MHIPVMVFRGTLLSVFPLCHDIFWMWFIIIPLMVINHVTVICIPKSIVGFYTKTIHEQNALPTYVLRLTCSCTDTSTRTPPLKASVNVQPSSSNNLSHFSAFTSLIVFPSNSRHRNVFTSQTCSSSSVWIITCSLSLKSIPLGVWNGFHRLRNDSATSGMLDEVYNGSIASIKPISSCDRFIWLHTIPPTRTPSICILWWVRDYFFNVLGTFERLGTHLNQD